MTMLGGFCLALEGLEGSEGLEGLEGLEGPLRYDVDRNPQRPYQTNKRRGWIQGGCVDGGARGSKSLVIWPQQTYRVLSNTK